MMLATLPRFPCSPDKRPLIPDWPNNATFDPISDYKAPWINEHLWPLTGVLTGHRSGFDVLDIDPRGMEWLAAHELPATRRHRTRRGGWHILFQHEPGLRNSAGRIAEGVDIRADGGFVIWWPRAGFEVVEGKLAEWPSDLISAARSSDSTVSNQLRAALSNGATNFVFKQRTSRTEVQVRSHYLQRAVETAQVGHRNNMIHWAARRFREMISCGQISEAVAEELLLASCRILFGEAVWPEVRNTIRSGLRTKPEA